MNKTLIIDVVMKQLEALSIEELLDVRAKVDALIQNKTSFVYQDKSGFSSTPNAIYYYKGNGQPISSEMGITFEIKPVSSPKPENNNSLGKIIEIIDEWMADESDYDQETYPQIEAALNQNRVSL
ncbi:MAG: hypothetical protein EAZ76_05335 [Nostocales cyanobacterium]|nr:MAG: hypothetical protein EAZ87_01070 [Nostocales cyanobacterium]TAF18215.1 MAG: hypothetical protein EAZ76_05335 [Nostocales cyanobacterium]